MMWIIEELHKEGGWIQCPTVRAWLDTEQEANRKRDLFSERYPGRTFRVRDATDDQQGLLTIYARPGEHHTAVLTIFADGRILVRDFAKPSEAARQVLGALAELLPAHIRKPLDRGGEHG